MFFSMFLKALSDIWPMIFIFTIILISVRILYLVINKKSFVFHKELLMLCFIVYILLLYYTVTFQDNNYGTNNFVPFKEMFRYQIGSRLFIKNVLGNIILFLPFGFFTAYYLDIKKPYLIIILTLIASTSIEFVQMSIGRVFDIDDIMLNTIGGIVGFYLFSILSKIGKTLPNFMKSELFLNLISVIMLIGVIVLI